MVGGGYAAAAAPAPAVFNLNLTSADTSVATDGAHDAYPGGVDQSAANWSFVLNNDFTTGEKVVIDVGNGSGVSAPGVTHCVSATDFVAFANTPTVNVSGNAGNGSTPPLIHWALTSQESSGACAAIKDQLSLTIVHGATGDTTGTDDYTVTIGNLHYSLGTATHANIGGNVVGVAGTDTPTGTGATSHNLVTTAAPGPGDAANAKVEDVGIAANSGTVGLMRGATGAISNISGMEEYPGQLAFSSTPPAGGEETVCLQGDSWFSGTATVTAKNTMVSATGNTGSFGSSVTLSPTGGNCYDFWAQRTSESPATLTLSGLQAGSFSVGPIFVDLTDVDAAQTASTVAFVTIGANRVAGGTADDTAIQSFNSTFDFGYELSRTNDLATVVMAADTEANDALASNFLASYLNTGVLITPGTALPTNLVNLFRNEGIGTIYITGGPLVISNTLSNQLSHTQAYFFRDGSPIPATDVNGNPIFIKVIRIFGSDADGTASAVDQWFGLFTNGSVLWTPGAYPVASGTPGGAYNDTSGNASPVSAAANWEGSSISTVIVASDADFQDALAAGPLVYFDGLQVVLTHGNRLTASAANTIANLAPAQVIVVGGPAVIPNSAVSQIAGLGPSVLRVAGISYMDTSQQMARFALNNYNQDGVRNGLDDFSYSVGSARGNGFADALSSAANLGFGCGFSPLLLTQNNGTVGSVIDGFLQQAGSPNGIGSNNDGIGYITVYGGTLAQTPSLVQNEINDLAKGAGLA